ncbi:hypothetical protein FOC4_g10000058 [Fusarium odoratissimum]|uniref:Uncharacterized protein n=2 Tax=Fusarium oxysporum species complex TaxID=171631 RepID=N1S3E9_FUSC4|nr:hypothetical protein FOC4_g10000058 [Fusarium odoratissimum]ENH74667.1 hypothetical protein FOC1_g10000268 [Fusarium oxysporum f. sp. cubense race 1]
MEVRYVFNSVKTRLRISQGEDITQFICDALEKHAGTSKNKDSANDDHPTSKRSRSEGAIDGTASPLQKRAKTVADSHTEVPTAANTGRCLQEHQTPNIGPLTSSPSVTQGTF